MPLTRQMRSVQIFGFTRSLLVFASRDEALRERDFVSEVTWRSRTFRDHGVGPALARTDAESIAAI